MVTHIYYGNTHSAMVTYIYYSNIHSAMVTYILYYGNINSTITYIYYGNIHSTMVHNTHASCISQLVQEYSISNKALKNKRTKFTSLDA